jgi:ATP-binding cassette, subfamily B (MDR/TAP), member 1
VTFAYPKDKSKSILKNLSMRFDLKSSALVGESGCGKSTIAQLLLRFYDPDEGEILIDGRNLREYDLSWLRKEIGYVGQEPVLFATSIRENLLYANPEATEDDMKDALRQAEVYDFIFENLENRLETYVGIGGSQISGGQKQRIAIARALIKKPKILILDEATSALDRTNELLIQSTLNKISKNLTTITIAHRVGTIMSSNRIFVLDNGTIV